MKLYKQLLVLVLVLVTCIVSQVTKAYAVDDRFYGTAAYRDNVNLVITTDWHAALVTSNAGTSVVEAAGNGLNTRYADWNTFLGSGTFKGYRKNLLYTDYDHKKALWTAETLADRGNVGYTVYPIIKTSLSSGKFQPSQVTNIRCDGLVEYAYNFNGIKIDGIDQSYAENISKTASFYSPMIQASLLTRVTYSTTVITGSSWTYSNNAQVQGDWFYVRDMYGNIVPGSVDNGDRITVLGINASSQLAFVEYPTSSGVKSAFISNVPSIIKYYYQNQYRNGSTSETVYNEVGQAIGSLDPWEYATPLYRHKVSGKLCIVYNTAAGNNTKTGFVNYNGGFSTF